jgi:hypothetical protein
MNVQLALNELEKSIFDHFKRIKFPKASFEDLKLLLLHDLNSVTIDDRFCYGIKYMGSTFDHSIIINYEGLTLAFACNWDANPDGMNRFLIISPLIYNNQALYYGRKCFNDDKVMNSILRLSLDIRKLEPVVR